MDLPVAGLAFRESAGGQKSDWTLDGASRLLATADARTDLFVDPATGQRTLNAPRLLTAAPGGDFLLAARVTVAFESTYDAGVLLLWAGEGTWAKLCFEFSPQGQAMVVSVVTRGRSDDANGYIVDGDSVWLRIGRVRGAYAFHASSDGQWWQLVRHFALDAANAQVGFGVQSPLGNGCRAAFADVTFGEQTLGDLRDGT